MINILRVCYFVMRHLDVRKIARHLMAFAGVSLMALVSLAQTDTFSRNGTFTGTVTAGRFNNFYYVDGTTYATIQAAITAACDASPSGGTVFIPPGTYAQGST